MRSVCLTSVVCVCVLSVTSVYDSCVRVTSLYMCLISVSVTCVTTLYDNYD